jgi:16S rRNA (adenine1518-N6/adenine1519-N6)-dimethyltransferase
MKAKKSLGQNFLNDEDVLEAMLEAAVIAGTDTVLEVGPGKGSLTEKLLKHSFKVVAVEKDDRLIGLLEKHFATAISQGKLILVHGDILTLSPESLIAEGPYKIVANIPYYITGQFVRKFLEAKSQPENMVLMVQKEVAERIALSKKESLLSLSVKAYGVPSYIATVPKELFSPMPKVDSAILRIDAISKDFFQDILPENFFALIKAGFAHKRKMLRKNLEEIFGTGTVSVLQGCDISPAARAEELSLSQWKCLCSRMPR